MAFDAAKPAMPCEDGKYRARILPDKKDVEIALQCGWKAKVARLPSDKSALDLSVPNKAESYSSGVFYRQNVPYSLAISNDAGVKSLDFLMFSPNGSPTLFLPASRTLFSDNVAEFAFVDGSPTTYKQETTSEAVALLKLPATVVSAYFAAMGSMFDAFSTRREKQIADMSGEVKLALARQHYEDCIAAISKKDDDAIKNLGCNP